MPLAALKTELSNCSLCAETFAATETSHAPKPVIWFDAGARILIAGQAPGMKVHKSGKPFTDPSGDRLRDWMGVEAPIFYDKSRIAIVPMAFCFPGYKQKSDLPPPKRCATTWRARIISELRDIRLTLLIGGYAQAWHLGPSWTANVTDTVRAWRDLAPRVFPLPHPSWRNSGWIKKNPWFEAELLPELRKSVKEALL